MREFLHLLLVDRERRTALAAVYGTRWFLPMVCGPNRVRAAPLVFEWLARRGIGGDVIGQWLGRVAPDGRAVDWLMTVSSDESTKAGSGLNCIPIRALRSSPSLLEYQRWALGTATTDTELPSVPGPFGALTWVDHIKEWVAMMLGIANVGPVRCFRATPHEAVLEISGGRAPLFFKGLSSHRTVEPRITSALAAMAPESFARTIALERQGDRSIRWLAEACPGLSLARSWSLDAAARVARACGHVQRQTMTSMDVRKLPSVSLPDAFEWATQSIDRSGISPHVAALCRNAIEQARERLEHAQLPDSWIPMDLDPENVLVDEEGSVRFIDLDDSFLGPAPLAVATFARRIRRAAIAPDDFPALTRVLYRAYDQAWPCGGLAHCPWRSVEIASLVLDAHLGWQRIRQSEELAEITGAVESARSRAGRPLAQAILKLANHDERR